MNVIRLAAQASKLNLIKMQQRVKSLEYLCLLTMKQLECRQDDINVILRMNDFSINCIICCFSGKSPNSPYHNIQDS